MAGDVLTAGVSRRVRGAEAVLDTGMATVLRQKWRSPKLQPAGVEDGVRSCQGGICALGSLGSADAYFTAINLRLAHFA